MSSQHSGQAPHLSCGECQHRLQDYVDQGLERRDSMQVYLHVQDCQSCADQLNELEQLLTSLEDLPQREVPAEFDARIMASIPLDSYRAMASIRAPRVPVFLERESLPAWITSPVSRIGGLAVAAGAVGAYLTMAPNAELLAVAAVAAVPQTLVWLQTAARQVARAVSARQEA